MPLRSFPAIAPLAAALLLAFSPTAHAEDDPSAPRKPRELDKVEVVGQDNGYAAKRTSTATKTDTPLRDVPQSVTVVTQELIRDQAMQNLADVTRYVPGIGMAQGEGNRDTPVFRGNSSTADMFVDGMRDDVQYFRDLYNIDRVEALKGPNAMIFGRGGSGGVLNRVTKQADWSTVRELTLQLGSWNKRRIAADVGQAISDTAAFRVTGMFEDSEGYRDDYAARRWGINPTFAFAIGEATTVTLGYEHFEDERVADRGVPSEPGRFNGVRVPLAVDPSTFFGDPARSTATVDVDAFTALVEHDFANGATLRNRTRVADYDKFYQNIFPGAVDATRTTVSIAGYNNATQRRNVFNQTDLTWKAKTGGIGHTLLAGMELGRQETDNFRNTAYFGAAGSTATNANVPLTTPRYTGPVEFRQGATDANNHGIAKVGALYVQDQIEFSPQWQAILGLRYDWFDVDFTNKRQPVGSAARQLSSTDRLWSPRAGLIYKPVEDVSVYASYSLAYLPRSGDQLGSLSATNSSLDPEEFTNYELGAKWDINKKLAATIAAYRLDRSNVAILDPSPGNTTDALVLQPGKSQRVDGVELQLAGHLTEAWSMMAGYSWQDGETLQDIRTSRTSFVPKGTRLAQLPEQTASLWNRYDFNDAWGVGLGAVYRGDLYASLSNEVQLRSYTRYDAAVFFRPSERVQLQLNVENLFDKEYAVSANSDNNITPGAPRAAYLSMTLRF
jgi:catecholate siderophore receptor